MAARDRRRGFTREEIHGFTRLEFEGYEDPRAGPLDLSPLIWEPPGPNFESYARVSQEAQQELSRDLQKIARAYAGDTQERNSQLVARIAAAGLVRLHKDDDAMCDVYAMLARVGDDYSRPAVREAIVSLAHETGRKPRSVLKNLRSFLRRHHLRLPFPLPGDSSFTYSG